MITHYGSLHNGLKEDRRIEKAKIDEGISLVRNTATYALVGKDLQRANLNLNNARNRLKSRKMVAEKREDNGHVKIMAVLKNRYNEKTADTFFRSFVRRAHKHHEKSKENRQPIQNLSR